MDNRHTNATILIGDLSPDGTAKLLDIQNDHAVLGFGTNFSSTTAVSFSDCEILFGVS